MKKETNKQKYSPTPKRIFFNKNKELKQRLINSRVVQKDLLYIIGLSPRISNKAVLKMQMNQILSKPEYLGQYGTILKILVNDSKPYNASGSVGPSYSAYVTYASPKEATLALLVFLTSKMQSIDQFTYDNRLIRGSFGTTKFCTHFLNDETCTRMDCVFLHHMVDESLILSKVL